MNTKSWRFRSLVGASTIAVSAVVALGATGMGSEVFAAGANHGPAALTPGAGTNVPAVITDSPRAKEQTLIGTYIESGSGGGAALSPGTLTALDSVNKLTCPAGQTCTITDTISVNVGGNSTAGNEIATAWELDGTVTGFGAPFLTELPTDANYVGGTWTSEESGVAAGKHKVQSFVYALDGGGLGIWTVTYNLYD
jgi:hypothetical protein